ncbi:MAG: aminoacyl-tRNA hydrolase [Pseudomonadales bacterium]|jgi:PTH1 family peptidyl-tRNA hydrolase|nr:aminoacyl-tRNA hydrolase [Pseudomonadales bacterium]
MSAAVRLIVGLGNPGAEYAQTRHNAGAEFVAAVADRYGSPLRSEKKFQGATGRISLGGADVRLLVPETYYNGAGAAVQPMLQFYRIETSALLVVHDELDLDIGVARLKRGGGHGGNNGLRDIIRALGGDAEFGRLRLGVGHPGHKDRVTGFLLSRAPQAERRALEDAIDEGLRVLPDLVEGQWERATTALHTRSRAPQKGVD